VLESTCFWRRPQTLPFVTSTAAFSRTSCRKSSPPIRSKSCRLPERYLVPICLCSAKKSLFFAGHGRGVAVLLPVNFSARR
jgi:hypothetical protein